MIKVTLKFPTGNDMFEFRQQVTPKNVMMDFSNNSMSCVCSEEDLEMAIKNYRASLINRTDVSKTT